MPHSKKPDLFRSLTRQVSSKEVSPQKKTSKRCLNQTLFFFSLSRSLSLAPWHEASFHKKNNGTGSGKLESAQHQIRHLEKTLPAHPPLPSKRSSFNRTLRLAGVFGFCTMKGKPVFCVCVRLKKPAEELSPIQLSLRRVYPPPPTVGVLAWQPHPKGRVYFHTHTAAPTHALNFFLCPPPPTLLSACLSPHPHPLPRQHTLAFTISLSNPLFSPAFFVVVLSHKSKTNQKEKKHTKKKRLCKSLRFRKSKKKSLNIQKKVSFIILSYSTHLLTPPHTEGASFIVLNKCAGLTAPIPTPNPHPPLASQWTELPC